MAFVVDLNADVGEGVGDDALLLSVVTSANVAGGGHAGGGDVLVRTVGLAAAAGVNIGAHVGYPDRAGFGRVRFAGLSDDDLVADLVAQVFRVVDAARGCGVPVTHIKTHGALYNDAAADPVVAGLVLRVHERVAARGVVLPVMGMPGSALEAVTAGSRFGFIPEGFTDRAYAGPARLVSRSVSGSVFTSVDDVVSQAVSLVRDHKPLTTLSLFLGERSDAPLAAATGTTDTAGAADSDPAGGLVRVQSLCVHGDTADAVRFAHAVRAGLETADVLVTGEPVRRHILRAGS